MNDEPNCGPATIEDLERLTQMVLDAQARVPSLIVALRQEGHTWERIARAAGMTRQGIERIAKRANGGKVPVPRGRAARPMEPEARGTLGSDVDGPLRQAEEPAPGTQVGRPRKSKAEVVGTVSGYVNHGLRDQKSRRAWADYISARPRAK
ncbi:hypothetical protein [Naasia sp. SYSU D00948]|uniref:hypothetical protein n=1 Tax=Naasia sp. SYSU D00948 TaxID=2817379 RepID=UPI001B304CDB|nr:hypothetical protein [Naasia sp. SYSU D00948]